MRSFSTDQPVVPLKPLTLRKAHVCTHWLLERKPFLPLDQLLLHFLFFVILTEMCSHLCMPLSDFLVFGKSILPLLGQDLKWCVSHFTKHGLFCFLPLTPGSSTRPTSLFLWLCFRRSTCHLHEVWILLPNTKYLVKLVLFQCLLILLLFPELVLKSSHALGFISCGKSPQSEELKTTQMCSHSSGGQKYEIKLRAGSET